MTIVLNVSYFLHNIKLTLFIKYIYYPGFECNKCMTIDSFAFAFNFCFLNDYMGS